jgi:hypothetical protein
MVATTERSTVKKALSTIVAVAALVVLVVPAAEATIDRSLPTTYSHAKAAKATKTWAKAKRAGAPISIFVSVVVICPEQEAGDSWGYCTLVPSESHTGTPSADGLATNVTYNDGAGT